jgi:methyltransferase-like protein
MKNKNNKKGNIMTKKVKSLGFYPSKTNQINSYNNLRDILLSNKSDVKKTLSKIHELILALPQENRVDISSLPLGYIQYEINEYKNKFARPYRKD